MKIQQILRLVVILVLLWFLLSGMVKPLLFLLGALSILIITYYSVRMDVLHYQGQSLSFSIRRLLKYWCWLAKEICKANIAVAKRVIDPDMSIDPVLKAISVTPRSDLGKVIFANSITLTPGTVALNMIGKDKILVHALDRSDLHDLEQGDMVERVAKLEPVMGQLNEGAK